MREDVQKLKAIYLGMLRQATPLDVHKACVDGRLYEYARLIGVLAQREDRRLTRNDFPSPCIGFDNGEGLRGYERRLFQKIKRSPRH